MKHKNNTKVFFCIIFFALIINFSFAQDEQSLPWLNRFAQEQQAIWQTERATAESIAQIKGLPIREDLSDGKVIELQKFDNGRPLYYITQNLNAAKTVSTNKVWSGGGYGFSLNGGSETLGIWDGGRPSNTHQELSGRVIYGDAATTIADHSTHVGGTMIANGVQGNAKGMSNQARLRSYDWNNDASEMATAAAAGLKVSNHSYGYITGWRFNENDNNWYWYGDIGISTTQDYNFGFYSSYAQTWDNIAKNAPYYLIVKAAGNDRGEGPTSQPVSHLYWSGGQWVSSNSIVRDLDGGSQGYDCISYMGVAKNILTVGSVNDITSGYTQPSSVVMTSYSGWGPTDDGRIKPDVVGNGQDVYSCIATSSTAYATYLGTSCSVANISGSIGLLLQNRKNYFGNNRYRSSTIKALVIHTADEAGPSQGPDYMFGWGLMNTLKAVQLMKSDSAAGGNHNIREYLLSQNGKIEFPVYSDGLQPIRVTICWTDPAGTPPAVSLNPTTKMLVNDLDLRVIGPDTVTYYPWILDPASPATPATKGENIRDNVEQVYLESSTAGLYTIKVNHKGNLSGGSQYFSVVVSGVSRLDKDICVTSIMSPVGAIDSSSAITPRVKVINNGSSNETFTATFKIGNVYTNTRSKFLRVGIEDTVNFQPWVPVRGSYVTICSTYLAGDQIPDNNKMSDSVTTRVKDIGVVSIESPLSVIESTGIAVEPSVRIKNYGTNQETFNVNFRITNTAINQNRTKTLLAGEEDTLNFNAWLPTRGSYRARCSTYVMNDAIKINDTLSKSVTVIMPGSFAWLPRQNILPGIKPKAVKSGGSLAVGRGNKIYALKGNNTRDFYCYDCERDVWTALESIPDNPINKKRVNKGAALAYNSDSSPDFVYAVRGNKTLEFWAYNISNRTWSAKSNIPMGSNAVKLKGGTGISYLLNRTEQFIYFLKGSGTTEFYAYHCQADTWNRNLTQAPLGPHGKPFKDGTCMTTDGDNLLYVLKGGGKNNEFYAYNILLNTWNNLESLPAYNSITMKKTKVKDGASICFNGDSLIYAIKGGNNQEFWQYNITRNRWQILDTIPKGTSGKKIGGGGSLVYVNNLIYALKGNKTFELWMHTTSVTDMINSAEKPYGCTAIDGNLTGNADKLNLTIQPNPLTQTSLVSFVLDREHNVRIRLYNSSGQLVNTLLDTELTQGAYSIPISKSNLSKGVYLLRCDIGKYTEPIKLIVK